MDDQTKDIVASRSMENGSGSAPSLVVEDYAEDAAALNIPDDKAREFLETLWNIMLMCADVEMGFDPVSLICGQNEKPSLSGPFAASGMVESDGDKKEAR
ncbi:hypothetical protein [Hyphobacterium sp.]|uniref:hypothetical protein n=1 Tax=Hyphobacterium sp. TaxID=2004662 RepID=UPI0037480132